jgi:hypothetical protein
MSLCGWVREHYFYDILPLLWRSWLIVAQGYLSFWNDSISYALRGCILIELALRRRIALVKDVNRRRNPLPDRLVEVIDDRHTGETILDETLKMMKAQEGNKFTINSWIDLLSGKCFKCRREQALKVPLLCDDYSVSHKEGDLSTIHLQGKHGMS